MGDEPAHGEVHRDVAAQHDFVIKFLDALPLHRIAVPAQFQALHQRIEAGVSVVEGILGVRGELRSGAAVQRRPDQPVRGIVVGRFRILVQIEPREAAGAAHILADVGIGQRKVLESDVALARVEHVVVFDELPTEAATLGPLAGDAVPGFDRPVENPGRAADRIEQRPACERFVVVVHLAAAAERAAAFGCRFPVDGSGLLDGAHQAALQQGPRGRRLASRRGEGRQLFGAAQPNRGGEQGGQLPPGHEPPGAARDAARQHYGAAAASASTGISASCFEALSRSASSSFSAFVSCCLRKSTSW